MGGSPSQPTMNTAFPGTAPAPGPAPVPVQGWHQFSHQVNASQAQGMISAGQEKGVSQCGQPSAPNSGFSGSKGGQLNWSWASELTAMLPDALKNLYNEGLAGLEARLRRAFEGLSPEQEVNIEAKLLAALEREKQAAVAREDYIQADYYKVEIDALLRKPNKNWSKAHSFARAASFMAQSSKGKGKGKGHGKGKGKDWCNHDFDSPKGKGKDFDSPKGKGKGYIGLDDLAKGKGKGCSIDSFDFAMRDGRGGVNDSFARRERAMNVAVETAHTGSFATDNGVAGSFASKAPPSLTFQREAFGDKASFASPRHDPSFAAGIPRSAAGTGQRSVSFTNSTTRPTEGSNTQLASSSSFCGQGYTTQQPSGGYTTHRPCGGSFQTHVPNGGSFASTTGKMAGGRSKSGLPVIMEF